jgi:hypothetical protein
MAKMLEDSAKKLKVRPKRSPAAICVEMQQIDAGPAGSDIATAERDDKCEPALK